MFFLELFRIESIRVDQYREQHPHENFETSFVRIVFIIEIDTW